MKTWIAFAGGAVLAAGIFSAVQLSQDSKPTVPASQITQTQSAPAAQEPAAPASNAPVTTGLLPPAAAPAEKPAPAPQRIRPVKKSKDAGTPVRQPEVAQASPPPAPEPQSSTPTPPAPQAASQPPHTAAPSEPVKPVEPPKPAEPNKVTIPAGTTLSVRLVETVSTEGQQAGQNFQATLDQPLVVDGFVIAERGSRVEGRVLASEQAGRVKGVSHLALELTRFTTSDGQKIPISTAVFEKQGEQSRKDDATKVAVGAGVGAALGAIFGGGKGAAIGAGSGAAAGTGVVLATRGKEVTLPAETRLSFRLKSPVTITERR